MSMFYENDVLACLRGHEDRVWSVAWSPNGTRLVSGSDDKTVRVWDAASGAELACLRGHASSVTSVAWSSDGSRLVSGSGGWPGEQTVVWNSTSGACVKITRRSDDTDVVAIAAGAARMPYRAISRGLETVIERSSDGQPIMFFATTLYPITTHPNCRIWAGSHMQFLEIITLEGNPEP